MERRGLLQYDRQADRYDLHPVVRGYASGSLRAEDRDRLGQRAIDYFSQRPQDPYEQAETLDDVRNGVQLLRTLLQMGQVEKALDIYRGELSNALVFNLEAYAEVLSLLRPFFAQDWTSPSADLDDTDFSYIATDAASAFRWFGQLEQALAVQEAALRVDLKMTSWINLSADLAHMSTILGEQNCLARYDRCVLLALELAESANNDMVLFCARLGRFNELITIGRWADAETIWQELNPMGRAWERAAYRPGDAEEAYALLQFMQGGLTEDLLAHAEHLARSGRNRASVRSLYALRGAWQLDRGEWGLALESLNEAIRMTREVGLSDTTLEARLALAQFHLGQLPVARLEAVRLSDGEDPPHLALAQLWQAIGDTGRATEYALVAYREAWADGEPYVYAYGLARATALLKLLGADTPRLRAYDPAQDQQLAFEDEIRAAISELRAETKS